MCIVCIEFNKGTITKLEADRAFVELLNTSESIDLIHVQEAIEAIMDDKTKKD